MRTANYPTPRVWKKFSLNVITSCSFRFRQRREAEETELEPDEIDYREDTGDVYHLPPPEPLPFDEYGLQVSYRVPAPFQRSEAEEPFEINYVRFFFITYKVFAWNCF